VTNGQIYRQSYRKRRTPSVAIGRFLYSERMRCGLINSNKLMTLKHVHVSQHRHISRINQVGLTEIVGLDIDGLDNEGMDIDVPDNDGPIVTKLPRRCRFCQRMNS